MHPVEQDSGYHIFSIPGLGSGIFGQILMIFGQNLVKLFVPFFAGDALLMAGTHVGTPWGLRGGPAGMLCGKPVGDSPLGPH